MSSTQSSPTPSSPNQSQFRKEIIGGLVIPCAEARAWFKRVYNVDLAEDHSQDISIPWCLEDYAQERGYPSSIELAFRLDAPPDFLLVTQRAYGRFLNTGPPDVEEVLQDDLKDTLKSGDRGEGSCCAPPRVW